MAFGVFQQIWLVRHVVHRFVSQHLAIVADPFTHVPARRPRPHCPNSDVVSATRYLSLSPSPIQEYDASSAIVSALPITQQSGSNVRIVVEEPESNDECYTQKQEHPYEAAITFAYQAAITLASWHGQPRPPDE